MGAGPGGRTTGMSAKRTQDERRWSGNHHVLLLSLGIDWAPWEASWGFGHPHASYPGVRVVPSEMTGEDLARQL